MVVREYRQEHYANGLDDLRKISGNNKEFAAEYELAALIALAHIADYRQRSSGQMLVLPLCLLKAECRARYEQETDRRNIEHGLGWQRYCHSSYVRREFREDGVNLSGSKTCMQL